MTATEVRDSPRLASARWPFNVPRSEEHAHDQDPFTFNFDTDPASRQMFETGLIAFSALVNWVEQGKAPQRIIASGGSVAGRTRPLCPQQAVFKGKGSIDDAANFVCAAPKQADDD